MIPLAGYIKVEAEKFEVQPINMKINSEVFEEFQKKCKERNLQMCTVIEVFIRQYSNGRYYLKREDIIKWKDNNAPTSILSTPINKEAYTKFKDVVKSQGLFMKHVLTAFIEDYGKNEMIMEFVKE